MTISNCAASLPALHLSRRSLACPHMAPCRKCRWRGLRWNMRTRRAADPRAAKPWRGRSPSASCSPPRPPRDVVTARHEWGSARAIRVVDYACLPAVIAAHSANSALRGTDAPEDPQSDVPLKDVGARCLVCRQRIQLLAGRASTGPTPPFSGPLAGCTAAPARRSGFGPDRPSGAGNGPKRDDTDVELVTAYRQT